MPCIIVPNPCRRVPRNGRMKMRDCAIICYSPVFRYKGVLFEWHSYFGPTILRKRDMEPRARSTGREIDTAVEWSKLPKRQRQRFAVTTSD